LVWQTFVKIMGAMTISSIPETSIVFLDIDGVLLRLFYKGDDTINQQASALFPGAQGRFTRRQFAIAATSLFYTEAVANLRTLIHKVQNTAIVISSNWRIDWTPRQLQEILSMHKFSHYIWDTTPLGSDPNYWHPTEIDVLEDHVDEIALWLKTHPFRRFVIYDDSFSQKFKLRFPHNYVQVDPSKLLTQDDVRRGCEILGVKF
jgi:hypothetical protein